MKKLVTSVAIATLSATSVFAGGVDEPVVEAVEMVEEDNGSSGWLIPLLALAAIAVVVSTQEEDEDEELIQVSDSRLKRNIEEIGVAENGLPIYRWQYLWSSKTYEGVMAQDVLKVFPDAVVRRWHGFFAVNYSKLGLHMTEVAA